MSNTYVRITFHSERIDDNTGQLIPTVRQIITGRVIARHGSQVTIQKDDGGTMVFDEQSPVMSTTMRVEYFEAPPPAETGSADASRRQANETLFDLGQEETSTDFHQDVGPLNAW